MMEASYSVDPYLPVVAEVIGLDHDTPRIFSLHIRFVDPSAHHRYHFSPGQFNMVYLFGVGEVAISIVSDPEKKEVLSHTIRAIGRVTRALQTLKVGDQLGVRGPFGRGWPLHQARGKDIVMITGGLGCAPSVSVIHYILKRRAQYGKLNILQGVKHSDDFIFRKQYEIWRQAPQTEIEIAADQAGPQWPWRVGFVTDRIQGLALQPERTIALLCGPEGMMQTAIVALIQKGLAEQDIYLSMERNMECGLGQCGHCQYGGFFICKDGPIFSYHEVKSLLNIPGF